MAGVFLTIPNIISFARLATIPFIVLAIMRENWMTGLVLFALAGLSDGIDGFIARYFGQDSELGAYLDPLADKTLSVAVYSAFTLIGLTPVWLLVLIVARDVAIVVGAGALALRGKASDIRVLPVSKVNTAVLILLAAWLLAANAFEWSIPSVNRGLIGLVLVLTAVSAADYTRLIFRSFGAGAARHQEQSDGSK